ncbi:multidrug effflux MFS transporter [Aestuariimicrobium ganziense]|uniref:multidrug effflux MFS transporter n=1 Tax=Aestuariimicrobium ganziense TaxID=2773677 RepID=UPI0019451340|nr:multidrug effflux MFS transporter [Aestuariimicrobium ganziense]
MTHPASTPEAESPPVPKGVIASIILFGAVGPLATDMYLPAFPMVVRDLDTTPGLLNLTLTTFFVGMALGQLVGGRFSDQVGRKRPLVAGTIALMAASALCAMAPTIEVMIIARLLQGFSGGWTMVIGRAVLVDLARGAQLVRVMNTVMAVGAITPLVAPLLGAAILRLGTWHHSFWAIALVAAVQLLAALFVVPESLPPERRHAGGLVEFGRAAGHILRKRAYVGFMMINALQGIGIFAYVSSSPYLFQTLNGLSPTQYSLVFAFNSGAIMISSTLSARLAGRVPTHQVLMSGLLLALAGGLWMMLGVAAFDAPLWSVWPACFALTFSIGLVGGNSGALASAEVPDHAGTGSALLGLAGSTAAAISPVLITLMGAASAWPPAILLTLAPIGGLAMLVLVAMPAQRAKAATA